MTEATTPNSNSVTIKILDREYVISCPPGEQISLLEAARQLDGQMREIRKTGKTVGVERLAVMAALNISHELQNKSRELEKLKAEQAELVKRLNSKLDEALSGTDSLL